MNIIRHGDGEIVISLSRRNLETLTKMLDAGVGMPHLIRRVSDELVLEVRSQEDAEHYNSEDRDAIVRGRMGIGPDLKTPPREGFEAPTSREDK